VEETIVPSRPETYGCGIVLIFALLAIALFADGGIAQGKPEVEIVPQIGHSNWVRSVAFSPDGAHVPYFPQVDWAI
jgi:hypothetical protein